MALIKPINGILPTFGINCFIAENATVIGNVHTGSDCTIWYQAVLRGDVNKITIGNKVNIQDGAIIHCTYQKHDTLIGNYVSIGHRAIVHGCVVEDHVLIGMGAIVMDGAHIQSNSIIAAGAVVTEGTQVEEGSIYAGVPAKKIKEISIEQTSQLISRIADNYVMYAKWQG
ncbi:MAG: gamma carbonic anhydrase family protein [Cytophagales bacterium]|nr:gamma carbonic anhydrase family protein [Cytophagales bacterium]